MTVAEEKVSERQAREVAEQAREARWRQPSFGKELFLGRLRLDLVHPHPSGSVEAAKRGEAFLARLREFCESQIDAAVIERDAQIPDKVVAGLKELGAFGMKIGRTSATMRTARSRSSSGYLLGRPMNSDPPKIGSLRTRREGSSCPTHGVKSPWNFPRI